MKRQLPGLLLLAALSAACDTGELVQPVTDDLLVTAEAKTDKACKPRMLAPNQSGVVTADDCVFDIGNGSVRYEHTFRVNQARLGNKDVGGNSMLTFTMETTDFDAIFGLGGFDKSGFPDPVYAFRRFPAGQYYATNGFQLNSFSIIGGELQYGMWVGGDTDADVGAYTLTTRVDGISHTCIENRRVYLQGSVAFDYSITNENSCRGTVSVGPYIGAPLNYQYWWTRLRAGQTVTVEVEGAGDPTMTLALIDWWGDAVLDFSDGAGDTTRSATFTAPRNMELYVEVSSAPDVVDDYRLAFTGPGTP